MEDRSSLLGSTFRALGMLGRPVPPEEQVLGLKRGSVIGHYLVGNLLGSGGMGVVYEAEDQVLKRRVAIKIMKPQSGFADQADRLLQEARTAACLEHERFVRVYELDRLEGDIPYMVMERLRGQTLREWLSSKPQPEQVASVFFALLEGVAYAHGRGLVHRDLKLDNVFRTERGEVKILDFGLAGLYQPAQSSTLRSAELPQIGPEIAGTPEYLAPESFRGAISGPGVDVWALGVMLYQAYSGGLHPFCKKGGDLMQDILGAPYTPLPRSAASLRLESVVRRALDRDLNLRYANAGDMLEALRKAQKGAGTLASLARVPALATMVTGVALVSSSVFFYHRTTPGQMVVIPGGIGLIGSSEMEIKAAWEWCKQYTPEHAEEDCQWAHFEREAPQQEQVLNDFYLDRTEVTNQDLARWLNSREKAANLVIDNGRYVRDQKSGELLVDLWPNLEPPMGIFYRQGTGYIVREGMENFPATHLTWILAQSYCQDQGKRLPTEAEWEYAARRKRKEQNFPWGDDPPRCDGTVFARARMVPDGSGYLPRPSQRQCSARGVGPSAVGTHPQDSTVDGVMDMGGNVSEWVQNRFTPKYPLCNGECTDILSSTAPGHRVYRGGNWAFFAPLTRSATRSRGDREEAFQNVGFRCAKSTTKAVQKPSH